MEKESALKIRLLKMLFCVEKESPTVSKQTEKEQDPILKLAAVLKKWKKQRKIYWMKMLAFVFFLAYILVSGFPVYLVWAEKWTFREGWSLGGKILLTTAMTSMAVFAIVAGWSSYKKWEKRNRC